MPLRSLFSSFMSKKSVPVALDKRYVTSTCNAYGHPEISLRVTDNRVPEEDIHWFLEFLATRVADGVSFQSGESLQVGWMYTVFQLSPSGTLCLTEPDMIAVPIKFIDSVDNTLLDLRIQRDLAASFNPPFEPVFPSLGEGVVVHFNYRSSRKLLLSRFDPVDSNSGWWLTDCEGDDDSQDPTCFTTISLFQLAVDRPDLVKFFALPPGLQVIIDGQRIGVMNSERELTKVRGSFLDMLQEEPLASES
jgi:hypothetical protein